jgi:hypothetical protein
VGYAELSGVEVGRIFVNRMAAVTFPAPEKEGLHYVGFLKLQGCTFAFFAGAILYS